MASAKQAYRFGTLAEVLDPAREREIQVERTGSVSQSSTPLLVYAAKMGAVVLLLIALLAFARIALTSATVTTMIESDALSSQIQSARSEGVSLEMEQSVLANPSAIKAAAGKLGMAAPFEVESITLEPDVVALDANGDLSLSGTVKKLAEAQG